MLDHLHRFLLRSVGESAAAATAVVATHAALADGTDNTGAEIAAGSVAPRATPTSSSAGVSVLLDTETLAGGPGSIITEFAALAFARDTFAVLDFIHLRIDLYDQLAAGREFSASTIAFHRKKGTLPAGPTTRAFVAAGKIIEWFDLWKPKRVWIQGTDFDRPLVENFFAGFNQQLPWEFSTSRDARTAYDLAFPGAKHAPRPHRALDDCIATLEDLHQALTTTHTLDAV